jgi:hypothetical protein
MLESWQDLFLWKKCLTRQDAEYTVIVFLFSLCLRQQRNNRLTTQLYTVVDEEENLFEQHKN